MVVLTIVNLVLDGGAWKNGGGRAMREPMLLTALGQFMIMSVSVFLAQDV